MNKQIRRKYMRGEMLAMNPDEGVEFYVYGHGCTLNEMDEEVLQELNVKSLEELNKFFNMEQNDQYARWGRGRDEDGTFFQKMFYWDVVGGKPGAMRVTHFIFSPKQDWSECIHGYKTPDDYGFYCKCHKHTDAMFHMTRCIICPDFKPKEIEPDVK